MRKDSKAGTAAKRRLSGRARFSAATRTYLASVPDPPGYKALFCRIECLPDWALQRRLEAPAIVSGAVERPSPHLLLSG
jgi:hypothetical protein